MSRNFLIGIALGFAAIFAVAVAAVMSATSVANAPIQPLPVAPKTAPTPVVEVPTPSVASTEAPTPMLTAPAQLHSAPIGSTYEVHDSDLAPLADAVKLNVRGQGVSKEVWERETPIAQKLLSSLCDCDQRNWLKHFVETGHKAMADSADYPASMELLSQLRRGNADLGKGISQVPQH